MTVGKIPQFFAVSSNANTDMHMAGVRAVLENPSNYTIVPLTEWCMSWCHLSLSISNIII